MYLALKHLHVTLAVASALGFVGRGALMLRDAPLLQARWVRVAPHLLDTLLLASAIAVAVVGAFNPLRTPWLATKIVLLLGYIVAGAIALRRGRTPAQRRAGFAIALLLLAALFATALTKAPLGIEALR